MNEKTENNSMANNSVLKELDTLLRCGICFEYMKTAMLLPTCSHNYCSLCIRRYIGYKEQCPMCRKPVYESDLRNNRLLDEIVDIFQREKLASTSCASNTSRSSPTLKSLPNFVSSKSAVSADDQTSEFQSKEAVILSDSDETDDDFDSLVKTATPRSGQRSVGVLRERNASVTGSASVSSSDSGQHHKPSLSTAASLRTVFTSPSATKSQSSASLASISPSSTAQTTVSCPVCSMCLPERSINLHLDSCLRNDSAPYIAVSKTPKRKPLPKLVYNLLSDKELRKKLSDVGLPTHGHRKTMIERHREYTLIYNAECDALHPKSGSDIIQEMSRAEANKAQSSLSALSSHSPSNAMLRVDKGASSDELDAARKSYAREHKSQFDQLIEAARKNRAGLRKPAVQSAALQSAVHVSDEEAKLDVVRSSESSSVDLIADNDLLLSDVSQPTHTEQTVGDGDDDTVPMVTSQHQLTSSHPDSDDTNVAPVASDLSSSLPASQVDTAVKMAAVDADADDGRALSPELLGFFFDDIELSTAPDASNAVEMIADAEDVRPVLQSRKKRQKQRYRSPIDTDESSSDALEQAVTAPAAAVGGRCLRSRDSSVSEQVKKRRGGSSDVIHDDDDEDYEPEAVSRPKRRKRRRQ